jgi:adhesin transport system outer membrane protein
MMAAHNAQAESLADALAGLVDSHPQILAGKNTVAAADQQIRQAFAGYLPTVSVAGDSGYEYINNPPRRANNDDAYGRGRETAALTATQLLYDGGFTDATYETAKLQRQAAGQQYTGTLQTVLFEGVAAYLTVQRQRELLRLSRQNEENIKAQLSLESERVRRGSGISVDVLQAKSRLQLSKERRVAVEGALRSAIARYEQVFGYKPATKEMTTPAAPLDILPKTLEEAVAIALTDNPSIAVAKTQTELAGEQRQAVASEYLPTVNFEVAANYENDKNAIIGVRRDYTALVTARWNIFNGFATEAGVAKAAYDYAASQNNALHAHRKAEEQTRLAWDALQTARQRVTLLENAVNIASEVFTSRQRLREAGRETAINVLDAENEVFNARINLTSASFDAKAAAFQLLQAMGRLDVASANAGTSGGKLAAVVAE